MVSTATASIEPESQLIDSAVSLPAAAQTLATLAGKFRSLAETTGIKGSQAEPHLEEMHGALETLRGSMQEIVDANPRRSDRLPTLSATDAERIAKSIGAGLESFTRACAELKGIVSHQPDAPSPVALGQIDDAAAELAASLPIMHRLLTQCIVRDAVAAALQNDAKIKACLDGVERDRKNGKTLSNKIADLTDHAAREIICKLDATADHANDGPSRQLTAEYGKITGNGNNGKGFSSIYRSQLETLRDPSSPCGRQLHELASQLKVPVIEATTKGEQIKPPEVHTENGAPPAQNHIQPNSDPPADPKQIETKATAADIKVRENEAQAATATPLVELAGKLEVQSFLAATRSKFAINRSKTVEVGLIRAADALDCIDKVLATSNINSEQHLGGMLKTLRVSVETLNKERATVERTLHRSNAQVEGGGISKLFDGTRELIRADLGQFSTRAREYLDTLTASPSVTALREEIVQLQELVQRALPMTWLPRAKPVAEVQGAKDTRTEDKSADAAGAQRSTPKERLKETAKEFSLAVKESSSSLGDGVKTCKHFEELLGILADRCAEKVNLNSGFDLDSYRKLIGHYRQADEEVRGLLANMGSNSPGKAKLEDLVNGARVGVCANIQSFIDRTEDMLGRRQDEASSVKQGSRIAQLRAQIDELRSQRREVRNSPTEKKPESPPDRHGESDEGPNTKGKPGNNPDDTSDKKDGAGLSSGSGGNNGPDESNEPSNNNGPGNGNGPGGDNGPRDENGPNDDKGPGKNPKRDNGEIRIDPNSQLSLEVQDSAYFVVLRFKPENNVTPDPALERLIKFKLRDADSADKAQAVLANIAEEIAKIRDKNQNLACFSAAGLVQFDSGLFRPILSHASVSRMENVVLEKQNLIGLDLNDAEIINTKFIECSMIGLDASRAVFRGCLIDKCKATSSIFTGAKFLDQTVLQESDFQLASFDGATISADSSMLKVNALKATFNGLISEVLSGHDRAALSAHFKGFSYSRYALDTVSGWKERENSCTRALSSVEIGQRLTDIEATRAYELLGTAPCLNVSEKKRSDKADNIPPLLVKTPGSDDSAFMIVEIVRPANKGARAEIAFTFNCENPATKAMEAHRIGLPENHFPYMTNAQKLALMLVILRGHRRPPKTKLDDERPEALEITDKETEEALSIE